MQFSIIIPVYNRPQEIDELLESLCQQTLKDFEVVVVEDGSREKCDLVCDRYRDRLLVSYHFKPNSGPGPSRNYGAERSQGEYLIFLDSDCVLPPDFLKVVDEELCSMRKGQELGTYYFTPKVKEGNVMIRVGYMDFMGAYFKLADLTFTVVDE